MTDLHDIETTLAGTRVYPLMSRGELIGVLVCGDKRDHQGFAPDEDDALFTMARGVGSALGALREPSRDGAADPIFRVRSLERRDFFAAPASWGAIYLLVHRSTLVEHESARANRGLRYSTVTGESPRVDAIDVEIPCHFVTPFALVVAVF